GRSRASRLWEDAPMYVRLTPEGELDVAEAADFKRFSVRLRAGQAPVNGGGLSFEADGRTAWVEEAALRAWPGGRDDAAWQAGLTGMIAFARGRGWVDGARIRAHVETQS